MKLILYIMTTYDNNNKNIIYMTIKIVLFFIFV